MTWTPKFTIRSADNTVLLYTFTAVQSTNLPQTTRDTVSITNLRSRGSVVIDGGTQSFEAVIEFVLYDNSGEYQNIMNLIDTLETTIPINTPLILRMDKTPTTYYDYRIKRLVPFEYPNIEIDLRNYRQRVIATFMVDAW